MQLALKGAIEMGAACLKALAGLRQCLAGIVAENGGGKLGNVSLLLTQLRGDRGFLAEGEVVEALGGAMKHRRHASFCAADRESIEALVRLQELETRRTFQTMSLRGQMLGDFVLALR